MSNKQMPLTEGEGARAGVSRDRANGVPGLLPAATIALMCGVLCWFGLSQMLRANGIGDIANPSASEIASVEDQDVEGALSTMSGSPNFKAEFKKRDRSCSKPLAWVSVSHGIGQPPTTIRLRSGNYVSPMFNLTEIPVRIAIPYPNAYEAGRGELTVLGVGGNAVVSLVPDWLVSEAKGSSTHTVTWVPTKRCDGGNG